MPLTTATYTTATSESVVRRQILERLLREGFGQYGTLTGGSTSTFVDTSRLSGGIPDNWFQGYIARVSRDAGLAGAAPEGEMRFVTSSTASTGTTTNGTPVFTASPASGDLYQLWQYIHPQVVLDTLDQVMTEDAYLPCWTILTEVPDGDMEQNNTTDWDTSSASIAKSTSEPMMWGKRYLSVTTSGANGYATTAAYISVVPGRRYHLSALVRCAEGDITAYLAAYDDDNSANIQSVTTTSKTVVRLSLEFTAPSGCNRIFIKLGSQENGVVTYWDEVCLFSVDGYSISLPWWVKNKGQIKGIFRPHFNTVGTNISEATPRVDAELDRWNFVDDAFGRGQLKISSRYGAIDRPVYIFGTRSETAWANENTETKHIDRDWVHARMCYLLYSQMLAPRSVGTQNMGWAEKRLEFWEKEWNRQRRMQDERLEEAIQAAVADVHIYGDDRDTYSDRLVR
jgi:hypothetical protein